MPNIISAGISESLLADFEALKDTPCANGTKYHEKTIDRLAQYICCRNYARLTLEMSYLAWAVINFKRDDAALLRFFWVDESITPVAFRSAFERCEQASWLPVNTKLSIDETGLCIDFNQQRFVISATRVSLLSAFLELIATHIEGVLDDFETALLGVDEKSVKLYASKLQKQLYEWLKEHLPSAKVQQRFRHIDQWYQGLDSDRKLSDQDVISFWKASQGIEGYVKYSSALEDVLDYELAKMSLQQSYEAQHGLALEEYAQIVTQDEVSLYESSSHIFESLENLTLAGAPKFLSSKQLSLAIPHISIAKVNTNLAKSAWRNSIFGLWQSQIIQFSRNVKATSSNDDIKRPKDDYLGHYEALISLRKAIKLSLLSCVAILYNKQSLTCLSLLNVVLEDLVDASQLSILKQFLEKNINELDNQQAELRFKKLKQWQLQKPVLNKVFDTAQQALKKNNKAGFKDWQDYDEDLYLDGVQQLVSLDKLVANAISAFSKTIALPKDTQENLILEACKQNFNADLCIYIEEFKQRHRDVL